MNFNWELAIQVERVNRGLTINEERLYRVHEMNLSLNYNENPEKEKGKRSGLRPLHLHLYLHHLRIILFQSLH